MRYRITILLGAFLLFLVQPQLARVILPWFGGGPAVWSACLLFFQVMLLAGYAYAHLLQRRLTPRAQALLHAALLLLSLAFLPVLPAEHYQPTGVQAPTLQILRLLFATVGLPYLLLAATGPLLQAWFAREFAGREPYRLYSLSNFGSLAALLSFPFLFEPLLTIGTQAIAWSIAYVAFVVCCAVCAWSSSQAPSAAAGGGTSPAPWPDTCAITSRHFAEDAQASALATFATAPAFTAGLSTQIALRVRAELTQLLGPKPAVATRAATSTTSAPPTPSAPRAPLYRRWISLAALPSVMLLAVTNVICVDIAVTPFFWVLPLVIYLLTFVLTFDSDRWYRPVPMGCALAAVAVLLLACGDASWFAASVAIQAATFLVTLFLCGMVCHGELVHHKPAPAHLTGFYLCVAAGGALGGLLVTVVAPLLFRSCLEMEIGLGLCAVTGVFACVRRLTNAVAKARLLRRRLLPFVLGVALAGALVVRARDGAQTIDRSRNFFGRITVEQITHTEEVGGQRRVRTTRRLRHGSTLHGEQVTGDAVAPGVGHSYFSSEAGVGYALRRHPAVGQRPLQVGVIGLGTGTLAHYARQHDRYAFYEIDPAVARVAEQHFTYIADARHRGADVDIRLGDARVQLERELRSGTRPWLDVLVIDAFSSDSIPVHLLTQQANRIYWQHLLRDGLLLVHVSNRYLDLLPIVRGLAADAGKQLRCVTVRAEDSSSNVGSAWAIVTDNAAFLAQAPMQAAAAIGPPPPQRSLLWTDDFSSLWHVLR